MPEPTPSTPAGQRLIAGRYRLGRVIGAGSMGVVWQAYDEVLHRSVAVKEVRLPPGIPIAEANDARERTLREARAIAAPQQAAPQQAAPQPQQEDAPRSQPAEDDGGSQGSSGGALLGVDLGVAKVSVLSFGG